MEDPEKFDIGANPHPKCECVNDYSEANKKCQNDPTWGPSIQALLRGVNQAKWMSACREPVCEAFICKTGSHLKDNPGSIKCGVPVALGFLSGALPGKACDPEADQSTCCLDGPAPAKCTTMQCPFGYELRSHAVSHTCKIEVCDPDGDRDECCVKSKCAGGITFDYQDMQEECAAVPEPLYAGAYECYEEEGCEAITKCYRKKACDHSKMSDKCRDKLRVCAPGKVVYSHWSRSSSSSHCSNGDCKQTSSHESGGITEACNTDQNPGAKGVETCD